MFSCTISTRHVIVVHDVLLGAVAVPPLESILHSAFMPTNAPLLAERLALKGRDGRSIDAYVRLLCMRDVCYKGPVAMIIFLHIDVKFPLIWDRVSMGIENVVC